MWLNQGSFSFVDSLNAMSNQTTEGLVAVDIGGNGTLDLISANENDSNSIHYN